MTKTLLVVDDNASTRVLLSDYLEAQHFRVVSAANGQMALYAARHEQPDLILLDIMMPGMDGLEFIRAFRAEQRHTPIILLTARLDESDKVAGLELGADDYVTKPFSLRELLARIHAALRRASAEPAPSPLLRSGDLVVDRGSCTASVGGRPVALTPSEFELLAALMAAPGRVLTRERLLIVLHGPAASGVERTVDVHIRNLRAKIEPHPAHPIYVETVFGVGYRFRPD